MDSKHFTFLLAAIVGIAGFLLLHLGFIELGSSIAFAIGFVLSSAIFIVRNAGVTAHIDIDNDNTVSSGNATLYVGNLPYRVNEAAVKNHFAQFGKVASVRLMRDRKTGKRKGFGFVEVASSDADKIISKLNDSDFEERTLKVRRAKDKTRETEA